MGTDMDLGDRVEARKVQWSRVETRWQRVRRWLLTESIAPLDIGLVALGVALAEWVL